jgi:phosphoribosylformylglycinamidine synthase subunit PurQ / glutaminase
MKKVKVCILRTAGTNCDKETAFAFHRAGGEPEFVHINQFICGAEKLDTFQILALPGGFSYGDDLGAGRILANELRFKLGDSLREFTRKGKLIIGICNGFQILVKSGLLPGSLIINDSGKFEDRWVYLKNQKEKGKNQKCVWAHGLPEVIYLPVAHGEGKFVSEDKAALQRLQDNGQVVLRYCDANGQAAEYPVNPNGSTEHIAGICDESGTILGLMPHPERHIDSLQHPRHTAALKKDGDGLQIFKNGVEFAIKNL